MLAYCGLAVRKVEAFVAPPGDAPDHEFHRPPQAGEPDCSLVAAVAVWAGAIDHENGVRPVLCKPRFYDLSVRDIDRARHVALHVEFGAAHVEEHEIRIPG